VDACDVHITSLALQMGCAAGRGYIIQNAVLTFVSPASRRRWAVQQEAAALRSALHSLREEVSSLQTQLAEAKEQASVRAGLDLAYVLLFNLHLTRFNQT
jgi:hypothetical protein